MNLLQRNSNWYSQRKGKITSSRIGAILNHSPFQSSNDVMREMIREWFDYPSEFQSNKAVEWGNDHENIAITTYEDKQQCIVLSTGFHEKYYLNIPLGSSPDGLVNKNGLLEVKCPISSYYSIQDKPHYYDQVQLQLFTTDREWCDFFIWKHEYQVIERIEKNEQWIKENTEAIKEFYKLFKNNIQGGIEACKEPFLEEKVLKKDNDPEWISIEREYCLLKREKEHLEMLMNDKKEKLIELSKGKKCKGKHTTLFENEKKGSINYKKIIKEHLPKIDLDKYRSKSSKYWTLKIT